VHRRVAPTGQHPAASRAAGSATGTRRRTVCIRRRSRRTAASEHPEGDEPDAGRTEATRNGRSETLARRDRGMKHGSDPMGPCPRARRTAQMRHLNTQIRSRQALFRAALEITAVSTCKWAIVANCP
jgi:hypothetical protein